MLSNPLIAIKVKKKKYYSDIFVGIDSCNIHRMSLQSQCFAMEKLLKPMFCFATTFGLVVMWPIVLNNLSGTFL